MSHQIPVPPEVGIGPHITVESEVEVELRRLRERVEALEACAASVQQGAVPPCEGWEVRPTIDTKDIRSRLSEYDPEAPRCTKTVAESRNYAPDSMDQNDPEWDIYTVTHYVPCCRPEGHEGECRNSRRVLGWPGYATLVALLDEVEDLRSKLSSPRAHLDDLLARVEQGARSVERDKIVAWLRYLASHGTRITPQKEKLLIDVCDAIERGEHLKGGNHE